MENFYFKRVLFFFYIFLKLVNQNKNNIYSIIVVAGDETKKSEFQQLKLTQEWLNKQEWTKTNR